MVLDDYIKIALDSLEFGGLVFAFLAGVFLLIMVVNIAMHITMFLATSVKKD